GGEGNARVDGIENPPRFFHDLTLPGTFPRNELRVRGDLAVDLVGHVDLHAKHGGRERLPLGVGHERERAAAPERVVQQEVERVEVGELEALDRAVDEAAEMLLDGLDGEALGEERIILGADGDHPAMHGVARVAGASVGETEQRDLGHLRFSASPASPQPPGCGGWCRWMKRVNQIASPRKRTTKAATMFQIRVSVNNPRITSIGTRTSIQVLWRRLMLRKPPPAASARSRYDR